MRIKLRQPKEITAALETVVRAFYGLDGNRDDAFLDDDGKTVNLFNLVQVTRDLDLSRSEKTALHVLESALYSGRNFARLGRKM